MIYTIGNIESYERYFLESPIPRKAQGGSVWSTQAAAQAHCNEHYRVYGVIAEWNVDTAPSKEEGADWHDLLRAADLVRLKHRATYLSPTEMFNLDHACRSISQAYGYCLYHVGSSLRVADYRDVDIRCILSDEDFLKMFPQPKPVSDQTRLHLLNTALSEWLRARTGLPIDFQFQPATEANRYNGARNAIGIPARYTYEIHEVAKKFGKEPDEETKNIEQASDAAKAIVADADKIREENIEANRRTHAIDR